MNYDELSLKFHEEHRGKIEVASKTVLKTKDDLSIEYTPGVAAPCRKIAENKDDVYKYTAKGNLVAVVTDGTVFTVSKDITTPHKKTCNPVAVKNSTGSKRINIYCIGRKTF